MDDFATKPAVNTFFTAQAEKWDARYESRTYRQRRELVRQVITKELHRLGRKPEAIEVLDFGCGGGVLLKDLLELGVGVTGVDTSRAMIEKARAQLPAEDERINLEWLQGSSGEGEYEARSYDIVVCTSVLEFVPELERLLARLCSTVRIGGMLLVSVPNRRSWLRELEKFIYRHPRPFRSFARLNHLLRPESYLNYQQHQLTLGELTQIVERFGLRLEEHHFRVAPMLVGRLEHLEVFGMMLTAVFRK